MKVEENVFKVNADVVDNHSSMCWKTNEEIIFDTWKGNYD